MRILIVVVFIVLLGVLTLAGMVVYSAVMSIRGEIQGYRQRKESREARKRASTPRD